VALAPHGRGHAACSWTIGLPRPSRRRAAEFSPERAENPASQRQTKLGNAETQVGKPWASSCILQIAATVSLETHAGFREHPFGSLQRRRAMLYTIAVILLILWLLGFVSGYTIGAFIHVLLVIALVLLLVQFLSGRRVV
jgi:Family of unknown function (DUF5670)